MKVGRTLYVHRVADWQAWLRKYHKTRREVWLDHLTEQGWFESEGFKAGESVVVRGTRLLLSEEQKSHVRLGD